MNTSPVGREVARVDGRLKVTGAARYSADHSAPGQVHAHLVTSTVAVGRIRSMDTARAARAPGVIAVYSPFNPLRLYVQQGMGESYAPFQDQNVRFRGQIIAMVVADTVEHARDAAALITTDYERGTARTSLSDLSPGVPVPPVPEQPPASATVLEPGVPSIAAALEESEHVVEAEFHSPAMNPSAMEPHASLAVWRDDQVTVYSGAQIPQLQALSVAARLGVSPTSVRVLTPFGGGAFGSRVLMWWDTALCAAAARQLGRPVKLVLTREQVFTAVGHRGQVDQTVRIGATRRGVLTAIEHESDAEIPAVGGWRMVPAVDTTAMLYATPNLQIDQRQVTLDLPPTCAMRGPNEAPGAFALETAMDELAHELGIDPLTLRRQNYTTAVPGTSTPWSSKHLDECYREGARRFGWSRRSSRPRARVDGEWLVGMGMATAIYPANRSPLAEVRIRLRDDDTAVVSTGTSDMGTGAWTMLAILGADSLGIPLHRVTPELGDSALPMGAPAVGSGATAATAPATQAAAGQAVAALLREATTHPRSPWVGRDPASLRYDQGRIEGDGRSLTFGRFLRTVGLPAVEATSTAPRGPEVEQYEFHSFGAHFCEVRVNRYTGEPRVSRFTTVVDVGRVVNARATRSQIVGGVIFGIGHALLEDNPLEEATGRYAATNLADYMVPVNADVPPIDVHWIGEPDTVMSDFGARGVGELGTVGSAAAIANAVFNATGVRVRETPITLDKLIG
ncbi:xanthine dehydrogenase family protein molybdopterin-binding subunit [Nocardioides sp. C4-1]|uniref:xanthine dehydrogenase family protein molybdopterin-binding subunit n=1 Tax=Nocardioides sp. C4-1 TaxID=3151851 RepID=UPI003265DDE9